MEQLFPLEVTVDGGALRGRSANGVHHFVGVPFAKAGRFEPPRAPDAWSGVRAATEPTPICPQPAAPLQTIIGRPPRAAGHDEDCLTLCVSTPGLDLDRGRGRGRPVMVWLHGGAYLFGSGSSDWYRPDALVREGGVVVVRPNYRVGAFGYLAAPGVAPPNLGPMDQIAALRWVQRNIAAFGGAPDQVTVFGESAGAHAIAALMCTEGTRGLFRRAILQSAHLGLGFKSAAGAARVARLFTRALGGADLRAVSAKELLDAQAKVLVQMAWPAGLNSTPAFGPVAGEGPFAGARRAHLVASPAQVQPEVDLLIGTTRDEMRAFFDANPRIARLRRAGALGLRAHDALTAVVTRRVFAAPAAQLADAKASAGATVYRYRLDWTPPVGGFGACHAIDLPILFGDHDAWKDAPMLAGAPWEGIDALGRVMRRAWTSFARHGDPSRDGGEPWPAHRPGDGVGRIFG